MNDDERWMSRALELARLAQEKGEVPVGAVLVRGDTVLGEGCNGPIAASDPTAHAEISAIRAAGRRVANYRLPDTTLYVTLEPCPMCAGAILQARVERLVFGAWDDKSGAAGSVVDLFVPGRFNHTCRVAGGVLREECGGLLTEFFRGRREAGK